MKLKISMAIVLILMMFAAANSQTPRVRSKAPQEYERAWSEFLHEIQHGEEIKVVQEKLADHTLMSGYVPLGGTGQRDWVFRIDDAHEIVVPVNLEGHVNARPRLEPARRWLRQPDGLIVELQFDLGR